MTLLDNNVGSEQDSCKGKTVEVGHGFREYDWILFDADETLFSFNSLKGLKHMFANKFNFEFTELHYDEYQKVNKGLWVDLQNGLINQHELQQRRFQVWADRMTEIRRQSDPEAQACSTEELNDAYLDSMAITSTPLEGTVSLLQSVHGKLKLGIVTNGFARLQRARLEHLGLHDYFDLLVISEVIGIAKPNRAIFDHAITLMEGEVPRHKILMVGDTLESDILGGINAEIDTCWINAHEKVAPESIQPTFEVKSMLDLEVILLKMLKNAKNIDV